jgi:hypothetical protein
MAAEGSGQDVLDELGQGLEVQLRLFAGGFEGVAGGEGSSSSSSASSSCCAWSP